MVLSVRVRGEGRPIVLLPWFGLESAVMAAAFEPVFSATTRLRRIYVDLPGTGRSQPVAPSSDSVLDAVSVTVNSIVGGEPYLLAGCSYGGYLAAGLARSAPTQVAGLLLVCTGVKIRPEDRNLARALNPNPQPGWLDAVPDKWHDHFRHAIGHQTRSVAERVSRALALNASSEPRYLEALRSSGYQLSDEASSLPFDGPVALVAGRQDRIAGYLDQFDALDRFPRGSYYALDAAGHYLPFEQPERIKTITLDWLAQTGTPGRETRQRR